MRIVWTLFLVVSFGGIVLANTIYTHKDVMLPPGTFMEDTLICSLDYGNCPWSGGQTSMTVVQATPCKTAVFTINMNFQSDGVVSFLVAPSLSDPYASPLNYISELSVLKQREYRGYNSYTGDTQVTQLTFAFRNDAVPNFQNVSLNYTVDLCCNDGCGPDQNSAYALFPTALVYATCTLMLYLYSFFLFSR